MAFYFTTCIIMVQWYFGKNFKYKADFSRFCNEILKLSNVCNNKLYKINKMSSCNILKSYIYTVFNEKKQHL